MRYIDRLQAENNELKAVIESMTRGLNNLSDYAESDKFDAMSCGKKFINPNDILLRVSELLSTHAGNIELPHETPCLMKDCVEYTWHVSGYCNKCRNS